jgi:hypothetical protein
LAEKAGREARAKTPAETAAEAEAVVVGLVGQWRGGAPAGLVKIIILYMMVGRAARVAAVVVRALAAIL